jgi:hypothetical protein
VPRGRVEMGARGEGLTCAARALIASRAFPFAGDTAI